MTNPTPHGQVPEALRLAEEISNLVCSSEAAAKTIAAAADELCRLHVENATRRARVVAAPTSPAFVYAGERGRDLEDLLDGYDHGTAFYTSPQQEPVLATYTLPPLPDPDLRDVGTKQQDLKDYLRGYATEYAKQALQSSQPAPVPLSDDAKDAARYRWLRTNAIGAFRTNNGNGPVSVYHLSKIPALPGIPEETDAAIDAALAAQGGKV